MLHGRHRSRMAMFLFSVCIAWHHRAYSTFADIPINPILLGVQPSPLINLSPERATSTMISPVWSPFPEDVCVRVRERSGRNQSIQRCLLITGSTVVLWHHTGQVLVLNLLTRTYSNDSWITLLGHVDSGSAFRS